MIDFLTDEVKGCDWIAMLMYNFKKDVIAVISHHCLIHTHVTRH